MQKRQSADTNILIGWYRLSAKRPIICRYQLLAIIGASLVFCVLIWYRNECKVQLLIRLVPKYTDGLELQRLLEWQRTSLVCWSAYYLLHLNWFTVEVYFVSLASSKCSCKYNCDTLCLKKNDTDVVHYSFDGDQPILIIFGRDVAQRVCY